MKKLILLFLLYIPFLLFSQNKKLNRSQELQLSFLKESIDVNCNNTIQKTFSEKTLKCINKI
ncbi:hypothetical protein D1817_06420 [Flavobacteriaceae bacterium]|nr:hypothetical protein D1817_06420 [Flavobacteriaceae bacterium]